MNSVAKYLGAGGSGAATGAAAVSTGAADPPSIQPWIDALAASATKSELFLALVLIALMVLYVVERRTSSKQAAQAAETAQAVAGAMEHQTAAIAATNKAIDRTREMMALAVQHQLRNASVGGGGDAPAQ